MAKAEELFKTGRRLFDNRSQLLSLWQSIAENFYPERADFTLDRTLGEEFMDGLTTGFPVLARRELGNSIGGLLRPTNKEWFHIRTQDWDDLGIRERAWLERAEMRQRRAMYEKLTGFIRATKEADHDFAAFGQAVVQVSVNAEADGLMYRTWHLRDVAWTEDFSGKIDSVYRKWKARAIDLIRLFGDKVHDNIRVRAREDAESKITVWHCVFPADIHDLKTNRRALPFTSVYLDVDNKHIMEEINVPRNEYVIPRWQTVSGSQYAYSPSVVVALPDARTLQEMTNTLLEAGEKAVTPPLLGVQGALRSDINVMAGGVTWVDREYDERLGEVLRPLTVDKSGIPLGLEMTAQIQQQMKESFFLNTLSLPPQSQDMTAFEVAQRVQEYIRRALPLFEPMEIEYNGPICDLTFEILIRAGVFGAVAEMPEGIQGKDVHFNFESPLHEAIERVRSQRFLEGSSLLATASGADPSAIHLIDVTKAAREALLDAGFPSSWMRTEAEVQRLVQADKEAAQQAQILAQMQQGADIAKAIGGTPAPSGTGPRRSNALTALGG